ncbi:MAG TPA: DUF885 domain-containing protein, partial [Microbacterium sp.]|nr:DUF885 domain-containing protein [Microbacterium sp.]
MTTPERTPTPIDTIAEAWVDTVADLDPIVATYIGRFEHNHRFADYSPAGVAAGADAARRALADLSVAEVTDAVDAVTKEDLSRTLELELELHDAQWPLRDLNVIASPAQDIRSVFDLMP